MSYLVLDFVLTIPESKTHPFSLYYDTIRVDRSKRFGPNSWYPSSVYKYPEKMRIFFMFPISFFSGIYTLIPGTGFEAFGLDKSGSVVV